jgi:16S rRNA (guanine966-N2)-methyltransferase
MKRGERELRIIGGAMRGRKWRFPDVDGLRPTPDRVRETLFNWLQAQVAGARCLDLFAGSGALGLEALSRGAAHATFVDSRREAIAAIRATADLFGVGDRASLQAEGAPGFLERFAGPPFDIVFLDPPFAGGLLQPCAALIESRGALAPRGFVYVEAPAREPLPALPPRWRPHREGRAGEVGYHLFQAHPPDSP